MTILIKSVLVSLTTLSYISNIHCQPIIREVGTPERISVSPGNQVSLGDGVEPNQLPFFEYTSDATQINLGVHVRPNKKCDFTFLPHEGLTRVETIKQLAGNKVIFIWNEERKVSKNPKFSGSSRKSATTISVINMDTCVNTKNIEFAWDVQANGNFIQVVPFEDGFDVFTLKNGVGTRTSYDADGNQIGKATSFPVHSTWSSIYPVSHKSRSKGFFIVDDSSKNEETKVLNLVKIDGTVKLLREFSTLEFVSRSDESLYSICWVADDGITGNIVVDCAQYDESGNEKVIAQINREFDTLLDVKSLKNGDFALFALNYSDRKLSVVEMRPGQAFDAWSFTMAKELGSAKVVDFDEKDHTFVLASDDRVIAKGGKAMDVAVLLQKFSLAK